MRIPDSGWLKTTPIAHRGLWGNGIPENSSLAYEAAAKIGSPIEIDLYFTKDFKIVSFHDQTLKRMTGQEGKIWEYDLATLKTFRLSGSDQTIPTFDEVLDIAEGRSPLLIEIKNQPLPGITEAIVERLKSYKGEFAVQSFNPLYIKKVKKLAPEFIRGILATNDKKDLEGNKFYERFIIKHMALNFLIKPDFISYYYKAYPLKKSKTKNKVKLCWTVTSKEDYVKVKPFVDNVIYEGFDIKE